MTLEEAIFLIEVDENTEDALFKEQFRWFVKVYHPDNCITGCERTLQRVLEAFAIIDEKRRMTRIG